MRFLEKGLNAKQVAELLSEALDRGVYTIHTSYEYEGAFDLYCQARKLLAAERQDRFVHVVKLPAPHFKDEGFDEQLLEDRIDFYRKALGVDSLEIIQWMYRREGLEDELRIKEAADYSSRIGEAIYRQKELGRINTCAEFPYSTGFAKAAATWQFIDGHVDYLNLEERDSATILDEGDLIALRPLGAGKILSGDRAKFVNLMEFLEEESVLRLALLFPLYHPRVASVVVSISTHGQLDQLSGLVANGVPADIDRFSEICAFMDYEVG